MKRVQLSVYLDRELYEKLQVLARVEIRSMNNLITKALVGYAEARQSPSLETNRKSQSVQSIERDMTSDLMANTEQIR